MYKGGVPFRGVYIKRAVFISLLARGGCILTLFLTMTLSLVLLVATLLLLPTLGVEGDDIACIETYSDLKSALRDEETNNIRKMLDAFYPIQPNSNMLLVNITYCISDSKTNCTPTSDDNNTYTYMYHWSNNRLLLIFEPGLIEVLTFHIFSLGISQLDLIISPSFCANDTQRHIQLLDTLTTWVSTL